MRYPASIHTSHRQQLLAAVVLDHFKSRVDRCNAMLFLIFPVLIPSDFGVRNLVGPGAMHIIHHQQQGSYPLSEQRICVHIYAYAPICTHACMYPIGCIPWFDLETYHLATRLLVRVRQTVRGTLYECSTRSSTTT